MARARKSTSAAAPTTAQSLDSLLTSARDIVRFIVRVTDPRLDERVLDPATGTGGFLVESLEHLRTPRAVSISPA